MSTKVQAAVVGATGYSGIELMRLLARHPFMEVVNATSRQLAGKSVGDVYQKLRGLLDGLVFTASDPAVLASETNVDVFFLALPHGVATKFARPLFDAGKVVIDLSADFRLGSPEVYEEFYGAEHPDKKLLEAGAYVIPEIHGMGGLRDHQLFACPGCYPTSIQIPLTPLLKAGLVESDGIVVNSLSGVSGAGKKLAENYLFCERSESSVAYGLPKHRHLSEIEEQLSVAADKSVVIQFCPHLVPMQRGIVSTISVPAIASLGAVYECWNSAYATSPFINILPSGTFPDSQHVTGTNRVDISAVHDERTGRLLLTSAEDNLIKGASGQAIQIANLRFGFPETAGLL
ncbi:MAG: N-acetyl-gamma-glutamyl-phosphate reductase [Opitutae bacterium]|nr:N-acetyl-gamma-glutamyl-phosphate reductase [Opitutae bacterium]MBT5378160.1 N-acetyl-gamma-glutamyl-phosphate reductase [Opitutae bacterium]MBT7854921.1 N-acetyl-gamma-glutamyl-phosphate reductase [Opitutae bacterium]